MNLAVTGLYFMIVGMVGESYHNYLKETMCDDILAILVMIPIYVGAWFLYYLLIGGTF